MAELQQISINESTEGENISLEEQAAAQEAVQQEQQPAPQTQEESRPEWLPEKFQSPEEMAKAYGELEKKASSKPKQAKTEQPTETNQLGESISAATEEFTESGELSEATFEALEKAGLPREFVETYLQGQGAIVDNQTSQVMETVGGQGNYEAMAEWAAENISETELEAYNQVVESGSIEQATMAVRGLFAQFSAAGGKPPNLIQGNTTGSSVKPFNSAAQVTEAMRDRRYQTDPAYRKDVENRLAVTTSF